MTFPRPDFPPTHMQAWLDDTERKWLIAVTFPDITWEVSASVRLSEHKGLKREGKRIPSFSKLTPEQRARHDGAGVHLDPCIDAFRNTGHILYRLARARGLPEGSSGRVS